MRHLITLNGGYYHGLIRECVYGSDDYRYLRGHMGNGGTVIKQIK